MKIPIGATHIGDTGLYYKTPADPNDYMQIWRGGTRWGQACGRFHEYHRLTLLSLEDIMDSFIGRAK